MHHSGLLTVQETIKRYEEQIAALKEIAIAERAIVLDEFGKPQDINSIWADKEELMTLARKQLEAEYPVAMR